MVPSGGTKKEWKNRQTGAFGCFLCLRADSSNTVISVNTGTVHWGQSRKDSSVDRKMKGCEFTFSTSSLCVQRVPLWNPTADILVHLSWEDCCDRSDFQSAQPSTNCREMKGRVGTKMDAIYKSNGCPPR